MSDAAADRHLGEIRNLLGQIATHLKAVDGRLTKLEEGQIKLIADVAELKGRVSQLPSTVQLLGFVLAVLVISGLLRVFAG